MRGEAGHDVQTGTGYKTLNVSHSIGILLYVLSKSGLQSRRLPNLGERDMFATYAYELAVAAGMQAHRAERLRKLAKRMTLRSQLDGKELGLLVSLLRKAADAIPGATDQTRSKT